MEKELLVARQVAVEAGSLILTYYGRDLVVDMKGWADPVTAADRAAETHIRARIAEQFPNDAISGEEQGMTAGASNRVWIVDPLDGTANFAGGMNVFAVCITLLVDGRPVLNVTHDPIRGETFEAARGAGARLNGKPIRVADPTPLPGMLVHVSFPRDQAAWRGSLELTKRITAVAPHARNIGSSALAQAYVACGRLHAHARVSVGEYDIVGGNLMIEEAGGVATDLRGGPYGAGSRGLLAAAPQNHGHLLELNLADCLP
ncbi:MAG TPA: inositol monophosphatase [Chloroflexota bacterium]|jgi:myo-inositol-1(or 4)-monophosphatase|nr:inositol monophosphatase [Chloroflexota bacterium]